MEMLPVSIVLHSTIGNDLTVTLGSRTPSKVKSYSWGPLVVSMQTCEYQRGLKVKEAIEKDDVMKESEWK